MLIRKNIYSTDVIFNLLKEDKLFALKDAYVCLDGEEIKANSQRYQLFKNKGCTCVKCGLEGEYFAMEKTPDQDRYHLNLYGVKNGKEILFTKDHIIPKSRGGKNTLENYQVMCAICNERKANKYED